jgi:hypothetical protein
MVRGQAAQQTTTTTTKESTKAIAVLRSAEQRTAR